ncbi:MAG: folylpolyglutamate synthase/dihydrofolate synthase family protein [Pseudomonadota bacterium]
MTPSRRSAKTRGARQDLSKDYTKPDRPVSDHLLADLKKLHPRLIDLSLGRIERLLQKLGDPQKALPPVFHIAGTNGKGSTSAFVKTILQAAGKRVHVYTSPHLIRFHERICLAGTDGRSHPIDEDQLVDVLTRTEHTNAGDDITQFEVTTAAAFLAFAETPADAIILEVGLGGRLDATNVIDTPEMSIITPVAMDHADKLGDTLAKIAAEKAGIIKPLRPVVVSRQDPEAFTVIDDRANKLNAPIHAFGRDFDVYEQRGRMVVQSESHVFDLPLPSLVGRHQIDNAGTAVTALRLADSFEISDTEFEQGVVNAAWPARMQRIISGPLLPLVDRTSEIWLDGGHNPAAGLVVARTIADLDERLPRPVDLIVGMMGLKDARGFLANFKGLVRSVTAVPLEDAQEQPLAVDELVRAAIDVGLPARQSTSVQKAIRDLEGAEPGPKRILICGSLYLAGHVLGLDPKTTSATTAATQKPADI